MSPGAPPADRELPALLARLAERARLGMELGLGPTQQALADLDDPHAALDVVLVAGTNGKGSVCAMVESIARSAGLRTGLYTSPHLCRFAERIQIGGEPIDDDAFARALIKVLACPVPLTFFESLTVAAFEAFSGASIDLAVIEVGLGGRLDATNVFAAPLCTAITSIGLDHAAILGGTLEAIAREKAGILKRGVPVVLGTMPARAAHAILEVAEDKDAGPVVLASGALVSTLGLQGQHQQRNAAVASAIAGVLAARWPRLAAAIEPGLAATRWPGRLERIDRDEVGVLLDAAHNPDGVRALAEYLPAVAPPSRVTLVFGAMGDKAWPEMLQLLLPLAERRIYTLPRGRAAAPTGELDRVAAGERIDEPRAALARALAVSRPGDLVLVTGSIFLVGELRAALLDLECDPAVGL